MECKSIQGEWNSSWMSLRNVALASKPWNGRFFEQEQECKNVDKKQSPQNSWAFNRKTYSITILNENVDPLRGETLFLLKLYG